jgi:hypothetical protein
MVAGKAVDAIGLFQERLCSGLGVVVTEVDGARLQEVDCFLGSGTAGACEHSG